MNTLLCIPAEADAASIDFGAAGDIEQGRFLPVDGARA